MFDSKRKTIWICLPRFLVSGLNVARKDGSLRGKSPKRCMRIFGSSFATIMAFLSTCLMASNNFMTRTILNLALAAKLNVALTFFRCEQTFDFVLAAVCRIRLLIANGDMFRSLLGLDDQVFLAGFHGQKATFSPQQRRLNFSTIRFESREQVKLLYEKSKYMDADDRIIFNIPLETRLTHPPETLQTWVKNMEPVVLACMKKQETRIRTQHNDIRSYFITQDIPLQESSTTEEETEHNEDELLARNTDQYYKQNSGDDPKSQYTPTIQTVTTDYRTHTEEEGIYILQPSRELHLPDRVETPRVGDTDRAASQQE
jgi:hypothetical protein